MDKKPEEIRVDIARQKAKRIFEDLFNETERKTKQPLLEEVCKQIEVCDGFFKFVTEKEMRDWLQSRNLAHLAVKVKTYLFS